MGDQPQVTQTPQADKPRRDKHLYQIDLVRLVTFAGVILDHVILGVATPVNVAAGGVGLFLRYTRYSFFALTGFVLTYQYRNRKLDPVQFWRRRYKLIGLPFLVWSLFYWGYGRYLLGGFHGVAANFESAHALPTTAKSIGYDLVTGNSWYHLYFLSVTMQIYAIFPLLLILLRKTWGYHRYLLTVSLAFQVVMLYLMVRDPLPFFRHGIQGELWGHLVVTLLPYQFFVLAGCIAAMHYEAFQKFMLRWRYVLLCTGAVVMTLTVVYYMFDVHHGETIFRATNVFMLHNSFSYVAIIVILYSVGTLWMQRRRPGSIADKIMGTAADRSFAIYLAHALALAEIQLTVTSHLQKHPKTAPSLLITLSFIATIALTVFIAETLRRSPVSLITTGRSRIDWRSQNPTRSLAVGLGAIALGVLVRLTLKVPAADLLAATGGVLVWSALVVFWHRRANRAEIAVSE